MKVLFDAYWWGSGPAALRHIMREIIFVWAQEFPDDEMVVLVRKRQLELAMKEVPPTAQLVATSLRPQAVLASVGTAVAARRVRPDVVFTHNFASLRQPSVVFIQDVLFRTNPEWFTSKERLYYSLMTPLARRSSFVLASSVEERKRMQREIRPKAIEAVGIGISEELLNSEPQAPDLALKPGRFLLCVGRLNVRKNLGRACIGCLEEGLVSAERPLVVVGSSHGAQETEIDPRIADGVAAGSIVFTGHVTDESLHWLYENSEALIYPSLGEGFGMPPLEAMAFGTPVVASDIPVMRENLGDLGFYADPLDARAIGRAARRAAEAGSTLELDARLRAHGRRYRWNNVVRDIRQACVAAAS
jgi:glycosyltransferase involved in cell wall biosynthesis